MQFCEHCKVSVSTKTKQCPLCKKFFRDDNQDAQEQTYPDYVPYIQKRHILTRIFCFLTIATIITTVTCNLLWYNGYLWCVIASATMLYLWILIDFTCVSKVNLGLKFLVQAITIPLLLILINVFSLRSAQEQVLWALSFVAPFVILTFLIAITITIAVTKIKWRDYVLYQISIVFLGIVPMVLVLCGLATPIWPSVSVGIACVLILVGMFIFMDKRTKNELIKRFHL